MSAANYLVRQPRHICVFQTLYLLRYILMGIMSLMRYYYLGGQHTFRINGSVPSGTGPTNFARGSELPPMGMQAFSRPCYKANCFVSRYEGLSTRQGFLARLVPGIYRLQRQLPFLSVWCNAARSHGRNTTTISSPRLLFFKLRLSKNASGE